MYEQCRQAYLLDCMNNVDDELEKNAQGETLEGWRTHNQDYLISDSIGGSGAGSVSETSKCQSFSLGGDVGLRSSSYSASGSSRVDSYRGTVAGGILRQLIDQVGYQLRHLEKRQVELDEERERLNNQFTHLHKLFDLLSQKTGESLPPIDNSEEE